MFRSPDNFKLKHSYFLALQTLFLMLPPLPPVSQRPHRVPRVSLHVQMYAARHHREPGAFRQQLNEGAYIKDPSRTPDQNQPRSGPPAADMESEG